MKTLIPFIFVAMFAFSACLQKRNVLKEKRIKIDSLELQYSLLMMDFNAATYDSIEPLLRKNLNLQEKFIQEYNHELHKQ